MGPMAGKIIILGGGIAGVSAKLVGKKNIVIIGGGYLGVELAGAIKNMNVKYQEIIAYNG